MKAPPYVTVLRPGGGRSAVPVASAEVSFDPDPEGGYAAAGVSGSPTLCRRDGSSCPVRSLGGRDLRDFWLKASAAGLVVEEEGEAPLFEEREKEISRLRDRVRALEKALRALSDGLVSYAGKAAEEAKSAL